MSRDWKTQWMLHVNSPQTAQKIQCNFDQNSRITFCRNWQVDSKIYMMLKKLSSQKTIVKEE